KDPSGFHLDRIGPDAILVIPHRRATLHLKFPFVPRACDHRRVVVGFDCARYATAPTHDLRARNAAADRAAHVWAAVVHRVDLGLTPAQDANLPALEVKDPELAHLER